MKELHPGLLFLTFVAGIVILALSSIFTYIFFTTLTPGFLGILLGVFGVCNDVGKIAFLPAVVLCVMSGRKGHAFFFFCLWLGCFSISLVASQGFDLNQKTKIKNEVLTSSDDYKRQQALFGTEHSSIADLKKDIASLRSSRDGEIKNSGVAYDTQIRYAKKNDWITTPDIGVNALTEKKRKVEASTRSRIDIEISTKEKQLRQKESGLKNIDKGFDSMSKNIDTTEGLISFSNWLSSVSGQDPDKIIGWFYIFKNIFSEFLGLGLIMLSGLELKRQTPTEKKPGILDKMKNIFGPEPEPVTVKNKEQIPEIADDSPPPSAKSEAIKAYAREALKSLKADGSVDGIAKISRRVDDIPRHELNKAKIVLESRHVLTVKGNTTYVIDENALRKYL